MCGIVGAISQRNITAILIECLRRLEYRGYDSAGIAVLNEQHQLERFRATGKIDALAKLLHNKQLDRHIGIAHTRWATHGGPTENNAHPHVSHDTIALVHNGIIENHEELRDELIAQGFEFHTETDSEVIAHLIYKYCQKGHDFLTAVAKAIKQLRGAYALAILNTNEPNKIIAVRSGSPVVIGIGIEENFVASDAIALLPVTSNFIYLEENDIAVVEQTKVTVYNSKLHKVQRQTKTSELSPDKAERGKFRHFMQKEIFEQPIALADTLEGRIINNQVLPAIFGNRAPKLFPKITRIQIVACGSSYHAALIGRHWIEKHSGLPCHVDIASEYRYRHVIVEPGTLFVTISQSGETADTLAALKQAKKLPFIATLAICNVPESSLVRESDLVFMTRAGIEVGVATTKAFTTQLAALLLLSLSLEQLHGLQPSAVKDILHSLQHAPKAIEQVLALDNMIAAMAQKLAAHSHAFFLGRGINYPVAMEGALKLKEISYIHAESYPAGELKHGPLALIDKGMPVIVIVPNDELYEKMQSNLHEVKARGGELMIFADETLQFHKYTDWQICKLPQISAAVAPIIYNIPLQLLAYHVAVAKGTDVDRPRNLAKSVTVE